MKEKKKPIVDVRGLNIFYNVNGKVNHAIKGVDMRVMPGEVLGVVGESGSGKSTIGKALLGINNFQRGEIVVGDYKLPYNTKNINKRQRSYLAKRGQMIFQDSKSSLNSLKDIETIISEGLVNFNPLIEERKDKMDALKLEIDSLKKKIYNLEDEAHIKSAVQAKVYEELKENKEYSRIVKEIKELKLIIKELRSLISINKARLNSELNDLSREFNSFSAAIKKTFSEEKDEIKKIKDIMPKEDVEEYDLNQSKKIQAKLEPLAKEFFSTVIELTKEFSIATSFSDLQQKLQEAIYVEDKIIFLRKAVDELGAFIKRYKRFEKIDEAKKIFEEMSNATFDLAEELQIKPWMKTHSISYLIDSLIETYDILISNEENKLYDIQAAFDHISNVHEGYKRFAEFHTETKEELLKEIQYDRQISREKIKMLNEAKEQFIMFATYHNEFNRTDLKALVLRDFVRFRKINEAIAKDYWAKYKEKLQDELKWSISQLKLEEELLEGYEFEYNLDNANSSSIDKYISLVNDKKYVSELKKTNEKNKEILSTLNKELKTTKDNKPTKAEQKAKMRELVIKMVKFVGFDEDILSRFSGQLSGGQQQRIAIARSLVMNPEFIVADEPISALDVSIQAQVINLLNDLRKEIGLTIIFIAHDLRVVEYISDYIVVVFKGRIVEKGSADIIFKHPVHPYTKSLINSIPEIFSEDEKSGLGTSFYKEPNYHRYSDLAEYESDKGHYFLATPDEAKEWDSKAKRLTEEHVSEFTNSTTVSEMKHKLELKQQEEELMERLDSLKVRKEAEAKLKIELVKKLKSLKIKFDDSLTLKELEKLLEEVESTNTKK